ncbi:hypothetical protein HHK36_003076 [Tetracentron sinense]|uniref:Homeobox domain-containing protein n=1 Tax=Tetracentron sinense TaxID=13715 RepID=A0A834ZS64_TETSI|nr:hypothetical protein HHK36_003076 [Tetracentron sinense]
MASQDSPRDLASSVHQFIISDSAMSRTPFEDHNYAAFHSDERNRNAFPQSLAVLPSIQLLGERMSRSIDLVQAPAVAENSESGNRRHLMNLLGAANETDHQGQRLSLTLGSHVLVPSVQYRQRSLHSDLISSSFLFAGEEAREACNPREEHIRDDYSFVDSTFASSSTSQIRSYSTCYGTESFVTVVGNSRYLKPTQSLLEEVVNVGGKAFDLSRDKSVAQLTRNGRRGALGVSNEQKAEMYSNGFSSAEKNELQIKITKLTALLDQVESRYEEYNHRMEEVVSSFEVMAGLGAANSYTVLAIQAMSRHFCSLRDAIIVQINVAKRQLSQDLPRVHNRISQLSLFDRETRHDRMSLQQLGMVQGQRQAWRPIRGLPENSVAILRSWLFEHFLHPYPNDSEKLMLASQTGLTKNQVSNWFINARVRLWKPMIEEIYREEFEESSPD